MASRTIRRSWLLLRYIRLPSLCVGPVTNAQRSEVFGACAAYAAVLVVFVSGNIGVEAPNDGHV